MIIPSKLKSGDEIRVIAPANSLSVLSKENISLAIEKLESLGFKVSFSKNCNETNIFTSSTVQSRVEDIHEAFVDKNVKAIFAVLGGFNSNQLLQFLDYELIKNNPKILCGYSDITVLTNAITAKTGLLTYSGLNFSNWAMEKEFDYNLEYFKKCLMNEGEFIIKSSKTWSDDIWYKNQKNRECIKNEGFIILNKGEAKGKIYGGNLCSFNLLQGTEFMPDISGAILFIEDDDMAADFFAVEFDRNLQSLIHQREFVNVQGIIIGKCQKDSKMTIEKLKYIIEMKEPLKNIPIIANANFGHTNPLFTFPIGGTLNLKAFEKVELKILTH